MSILLLFGINVYMEYNKLLNLGQISKKMIVIF